jgi:hypothetical protein
VEVVPYRRVNGAAYDALGRRDPAAAIREPDAEGVRRTVDLLSACGLETRVVRRPTP